MKNYFLIACLMGACAICNAQRQVVLDLTDGITWQGVFDAGFRPCYIGEGTFGCGQSDVEVTIKTRDFPRGLCLGRGDVRFSVLENNLVIGLSFYGRENRSLAEAKLKSETFAGMFGGNVTQRATLETFQNKHEMDYAGRKIDPPKIEEHVDLKTTTNAAKVDDFSIVYSFSDSYADDLPLVERLSVGLKSREAKQAKRLTEKIRPPTGYEHVSMEPDQENEKSGGESTMPENRLAKENFKISQPGENQGIDQESTRKEKPSPLPLVIVAMLVGILISLFRFFKARTRTPMD